MAINDRPPVDRQPKVGETVLHCGHLSEGNESHDQPAKFFRVRPAVPFQRPNGSSGHATILGACQRCWNGCGGDLRKVKWRKDSTWQSRRPVVRESPDNVRQG
jgi:hypothetical protein